MRAPDRCINGHDLQQHLGLPFISMDGRDGGYKFKAHLVDGRTMRTKTWEKAVELADAGDRWFRSNGHNGGDWYPPEAVAKSAELGCRWMNRKQDKPGGKVLFAEGRPCEATCTDNARWASFWTCGRVAVGTGKDQFNGEGPLCSMHLKNYERETAKYQKIRDDYKAREEQYERESSHKKICEETLEKIRPLLAQLGVHPDTLAVGKAGDRVGILLPAETAEQLTAWAVELQEIVGD